MLTRFFPPVAVRHSGDITFDQILTITRNVRHRSMAKTFQGSVLEVLGTANSVGCTVDGTNPRDLQRAIKSGAKSVPDS